MNPEPLHPLARKLSDALGDVRREERQLRRSAEIARNKMIRAGRAESKLKQIRGKRTTSKGAF